MSLWVVKFSTLELLMNTQMEAGSDTTASTLFSFILAMLKYPETLKKAQQEVDQVCGTLRSPTSEDMSDLPYIRACLEEVINYSRHTTAKLADSVSRLCGGVLLVPTESLTCSLKMTPTRAMSCQKEQSSSQMRGLSIGTRRSMRAQMTLFQNDSWITNSVLEILLLPIPKITVE